MWMLNTNDMALLAFLYATTASGKHIRTRCCNTFSSVLHYEQDAHHRHRCTLSLAVGGSAKEGCAL